jgi:hypothetical protein
MLASTLTQAAAVNNSCNTRNSLQELLGLHFFQISTCSSHILAYLRSILLHWQSNVKHPIHLAGLEAY